MSPEMLHRELDRIGRRMNRWQAVRRGAWGLSAITAVWGLAVLLDVWLRLGVAGRLILAILCWGALVAGLGWVVIALLRRWNEQSVAACLESAYPELDNHLINFIQFSSRTERDAMVADYVKRGSPGLPENPGERLFDRRGLYRALGWVAGGLLVLGGSVVLARGAWGNATLRILHPFSARPPLTMAHILENKPGSLRILAGQPVEFALRAEGLAGQQVWLDIWPGDDRKTIVKMGRLTGKGAEAFTHAIPKATSSFRYRFRAGDAETARFDVEVLPPLTYKRVAVTVQPPAYSGGLPRSFDALKDEIPLPDGGEVRLAVEGGRELVAARAVCGSNTVELARGGDGVWTGTVVARGSGAVNVTASDALGSQAALTLNTRFLADRPPMIQVISPVARTALGPGGAPSIRWDARDDYGLTAVVLQRRTGMGADAFEDVERWDVGGQTQREANWRGVADKGAQKLTYRLMAVDNRPDEAQKSFSQLIEFDVAAAEVVAKVESAVVARAGETLAQLIDMQRNNLAETLRLKDKGVATPDGDWVKPADKQRDIRTLAGRLLADPRKPLGPMAVRVQTVYAGRMNDVCMVFDKLIQTAPAERVSPATLCASMQEDILRSLTMLEGGLANVQRHRELTGLLSMLDALVAGQASVLKDTQAVLAKKPEPKGLVDRQDRLSVDCNDFVKACRREAEGLLRNDAALAKIMSDIATGCETKKVSGRMLGAAEQLDSKAFDQAVPVQTEILKDLELFLAQMNAWRAEDAREKAEELAGVAADVKRRLDEVKKLETEIVETIRETLQQKDKDNKEMEKLEEEIGELKSNMAEVLLQIARDLHIFPELPVGNDLVADVSQVYEETKQVPGSAEKAATEWGLQKEDFILELLETATERMEEMEMWLYAKPDAIARNTENFDQAELPEIPVIPMASELSDVIGDLLEQQEEAVEKGDDSATNQGSADMPPGWSIGEGEFVNYSAQGKSGNERPDHKEQDGKSLVGRQGMSDGETAAASGKINDGDENIEARRTSDSSQSGQVQEEGHKDAVATGGGKSSGYDDQLGMSGTGPRRDAATGDRSDAGLQALLRREAETLYARASMAHLRTGSLDEAVNHMRTAEEAIAQNRPVSEVREWQRRAAMALKRTQAELAGGAVVSLDTSRSTRELPGQETGAADEAPAAYREQVAEYFKALNEETP